MQRRTRGYRPRPRQRGPAGGAGGPGGRSPEDQQVLVRRVIAGGVALVVVILLIVVIQGCLSSATRSRRSRTTTQGRGRSSSSPTRRATSPVQDRLVPAGARRNLQVQVNQLRGDAEQRVERGQEARRPRRDEVAPSRTSSSTLELRARRADEDRRSSFRPRSSKQASSATPAINQITGQIPGLPRLRRRLLPARGAPASPGRSTSSDIGGQRIVQSRFLADPLSWLDQNVVAPAPQRRRGRRRRRRRQGGARRPRPRPGRGQRRRHRPRQRSPPNRIPASPPPTFTVSSTNQGENDENDVQVGVSITGAGAPITVNKTVDDGGRRVGHGRDPARPPRPRRAAGDHQGHGQAGRGREEDRQQHRDRTPRSSRS